MDSDNAVAPNILHVVNGEFYAGAERVQDLLALHLPEYGYNVVFGTLKTGVFPAERRSQNAFLAPVRMTSRFDRTIAARLTALAREQQCVALHAHTPRSLRAAAAAAQLSGLPLVYHVHSATTRDTDQPLRNAINALAERLNRSRIARAIAVSQYTAEYARQIGLAVDQVTIVHNGVDRVPLLTAPAQGAYTVGSVALFRPKKGLEILLTAFSQLVQRINPAPSLLLVGAFESGDYQRQMQQLAKRLNIADCIEWYGYSPDVMTQLQRMDTFVLPSLYGEGLPMVVLEAMAVGLPIVVTAAGGAAEAIEHDRDGLVVAPNDASALAAALVGLRQDPTRAARLGRAARQSQRTSFSAQAMAAGVARCYDQLLNVPRNP